VAFPNRTPTDTQIEPAGASRRVSPAFRVPPKPPSRPHAEAIVDASPGLPLPSALARPGDPPTRVCLARFVAPSGFGYPPGALLPPSPGRPYFMPTALLGFHPSKRSPLERCPPPLPTRTHPRAVQPALAPHGRIRETGSASPDFRALTLPRVPGPPDAVNACAGWMLPWVSAPSRVCRHNALPLLPQALLPRASASPRCEPRLHQRPGVSISAGRAHTKPELTDPAWTTLLGFPRRLRS